MSETTHLIVEQGPDKGKQITVPLHGARVGRSSKNDIVLNDPLLSRHHCRLFFKENAGLHVTDLGSANETLVNKKTVQEAPLAVGDIVTVGDTIMRVVDNGTSVPIAGAIPEPVVDLGLNKPPKAASPAMKKLGREQLIVILCLVVALALAAWIWKFYNAKPAKTHTVVQTAKTPASLEISYEKIEGSANNIFSYSLNLSKEGLLSVRIHDIQNKRHLSDEKLLPTNAIVTLSKKIENSSFFSLKEEYQGIQPNVLNLWDLSITLGRTTQRTVIRNRLEPELFRNLREEIEMFGKNELGLWAMQFPLEKLIQMSKDSFTLAKNLYDQREIKPENLALAINALKKAHMDLRSIEPKPDFYPESLTLLTDCKQKLQEKYNTYNFEASRAQNLKQWDTAAIQLRAILELIPDEGDDRHREARNRLLEAENRQRSKR